MHPKYLLFPVLLFSVQIACGKDKADTVEPSIEPSGEASSEVSAEPSQDPSSEASTEPSQPATEPGAEPSNPPVEDEDSDGFTTEEGDCDDQNPDVYPGAEDIPEDGIDQDCSGTDASLAGRVMDDVLTGDLIVTEVMNNPSSVSDDVGEWFEIFNNSDSDININGLKVSDDGTDSFIVTDDLLIPSRTHIVLALSRDTSINGGVSANYAYTGFVLSNSEDEVILSHNERIIDEMRYSSSGGYGMSPGKSISLDVNKYDFNDNDLSTSWCTSPVSFGGLGDFATPGTMNPVCPQIADNDEDGFDTTSDCDDSDPNINPIAEEIWYDGIDQNCNGDNDYDQDGDGEDSSSYGGTDCDDMNVFINSNAYDVPTNSVDENCDGSDALASNTPSVLDLVAGDLIISEIMYNPDAVNDAMGEWFEVYVNFTGTVNLGGLAICDNQNCTSIASSLEVQNGDYILFGNNSDSTSNGGVTLSYDYGTGLTGLGNSGDIIELKYDSIVIDVVDYNNGFPNLAGASMTLDPNNMDSNDNDVYSHWCGATSFFGAGDLGTPGAANDSCN